MSRRSINHFIERPFRALCLAVGLLTAATAGAADPMRPSTVGKLLIDDDPKEFFKAAASAGMLEVEASKLALKHSEDPQIQSFAKQMIEDHEKANAELEALAGKKNVSLPAKMMTRHQTMYDELLDEQSAEEFDEAYSDVMVASHKEAVTLFDEMADDAKDADIKAFAAKTLPKLQQHGGKAQELDEG